MALALSTRPDCTLRTWSPLLHTYGVVAKLGQPPSLPLPAAPAAADGVAGNAAAASVTCVGAGKEGGTQAKALRPQPRWDAPKTQLPLPMLATLRRRVAYLTPSPLKRTPTLTFIKAGRYGAQRLKSHMQTSIRQHVGAW